MDERLKREGRRFEREFDRRIRELDESGELSGLPGEGKPLDRDPDELAGDAWAARHVIRTSGARPVWADVRREIAERRARIVMRLRAHRAWVDRRNANLQHYPAERIVTEVARTREADARVRAEIASAVEELNVVVRRYNLIVSASLQLPLATFEGLSDIARARR
jgi:hypothetical protein